MFVVLVLVLLRGALHCKLASLSGLITAYALITAIFCLYLLCRLDHTNHQHIPQTSDKWWTDYPHARVRKKAGCFFLLLLRPLAFRSRVGACRPLFQFLRFPKVHGGRGCRCAFHVAPSARCRLDRQTATGASCF